MRQSCRADSFRNFLALSQGKAYHSSKVGSVYRYSGSGLFSSKDSLKQSFDSLLFWRDMWEYFRQIVFLWTSLEMYLRVRNNLLSYLDSLSDEKLRPKIKEFLEYEQECQANIQALQNFDRMRKERFGVH